MPTPPDSLNYPTLQKRVKYLCMAAEMLRSVTLTLGDVNRGQGKGKPNTISKQNCKSTKNCRFCYKGAASLDSAQGETTREPPRSPGVRRSWGASLSPVKARSGKPLAAHPFKVFFPLL